MKTKHFSQRETYPPGWVYEFINEMFQVHGVTDRNLWIAFALAKMDMDLRIASQFGSIKQMDDYKSTGMLTINMTPLGMTPLEIIEWFKISGDNILHSYPLEKMEYVNPIVTDLETHHKLLRGE